MRKILKKVTAIFLAALLCAMLFVPCGASAAHITDSAVFLEAESMTTEGHAIAQKTENSVIASYECQGGDGYIAHGGYANSYSMTADECLYVRARTLAEAADINAVQFTVVFTYYFIEGQPLYKHFNFTGADFNAVNEYQEFALYAPELIGAYLWEITLLGNMAACQPVEVDCFLVGAAPNSSYEVLLEAENMSTSGCTIADPTDNSLKTTYENPQESDWLAWGGYTNYYVRKNQKLYVRARLLEENGGDVAFAVASAYTFDNINYPSESFYIYVNQFETVGEYQYIPLDIPESMYGSRIGEFTLHGNLASKALVEIDNIVTLTTQPVEDVLVEAENMQVSALIAEKHYNSLKAAYPGERADDWLAWGASISDTVKADKSYYVRVKKLAEGTPNWMLAVQFCVTSETGYSEYPVYISGAALPTVGDYYDVPLDVSLINGAYINELRLFADSAERVPFEVDCIFTRPKNTVETTLLEVENMTPVDIAKKIPDGIRVDYKTDSTESCIAWGGYMHGYVINNFDKQIGIVAKLDKATISADVFTVEFCFSDATSKLFYIPASEFKTVGEYETVMLDTSDVQGKAISEIRLWGNFTDKPMVTIDKFITTEVYKTFDVNLDGKVDILDFIRMKKYFANALNGATFAVKNATSDGDTEVDVEDLAEMRLYLLAQ